MSCFRPPWLTYTPTDHYLCYRFQNWKWPIGWASQMQMFMKYNLTSNPNACERSLASHAVYMLIQCTPLLVEKAGVAPEVNLRNPLCTDEEARKWGNPPWLWNPGQTSPEVQNRGISSPTKRTCVLQKFFKKKKYNLTFTSAPHERYFWEWWINYLPLRWLNLWYAWKIFTSPSKWTAREEE